jgi:hypothetical protein
MTVFERLSALFNIAFWLGIWAVILNGLLLLLANASMLDWLPDRQTGLGFILDNRQRVEAAVTAYETGEVEPDRHLAAIVGISNVREAVELGVLSETAGLNWRFIGVAGAGADATAIRDHAMIIQESTLKPDLVLLGITPLITLDIPASDGVATKYQSLREKIKNTAKQYVWPFARRKDIAVSTERLLLDVRRRMFDIFEVKLATVDTRSPWRSMLRVLGNKRYPDDFIRRGLAAAKARGTFEASSYAVGGQSISIIGQTVQDLEGKGAEVIVILTPEHSWLRTKEPDGVAALVLSELRRSSGNNELELYDYRAAVADDGFIDLVHMTSEGSRRFSEILGKDIAEMSPQNKPLMAVVSSSNHGIEQSD